VGLVTNELLHVCVTHEVHVLVVMFPLFCIYSILLTEVAMHRHCNHNNKITTVYLYTVVLSVLFSTNVEQIRGIVEAYGSQRERFRRKWDHIKRYMKENKIPKEVHRKMHTKLHTIMLLRT